MTPEELSRIKREMHVVERNARYSECLHTGGCEQFLFPLSTGDEYCANCLTLFVNEVPQDPPAAMTPEELSRIKHEMPVAERKARYGECLRRGGCARFLLPLHTGDEYCSNCLTLFADEIPQDSPSTD
jgi:hypothetical protein